MIPDELPDAKAVYATDMLSTGFAGAENAQLRLGETVAVFAQGPVGLAATIGWTSCSIRPRATSPSGSCS